jgi:hypothetical protein
MKQMNCQCLGSPAAVVYRYLALVSSGDAKQMSELIYDLVRRQEPERMNFS